MSPTAQLARSAYVHMGLDRLWRANSEAAYEGWTMTAQETGAELMRRTDTTPHRCLESNRACMRRELDYRYQHGLEL